MPLHDLKCQDCGHEFEENLIIGADCTQCPECGDLAKIIWKKFPGIFTDGDISDPFKSHADGKVYSSKKQYRAELRAHGMVEVGNEKHQHKEYKPPDLRKEISQTLQELKNGERGR